MTELMQYINFNFMAAVQDQYHYWDFDIDMRSASVSRMWKEHYNDNIETVKDKSPTLFALWCNETGWSETKAIEQFNKQQEQLKTNNKMEKTSKVLSVQSNGSFESNYGTLYSFEVAFENGDVGVYNSKSKDQNKFFAGFEATYTIETKPTKNGKTFTTIKPVFGTQQNNQKPMSENKQTTSAPAYPQKSHETEMRIARMNALTNAVNWASAKGVEHEQEILLIADSFHDFIVNGLVKDSDGLPF